MSQCEGKRGFFILYDCSKEASKQCSECGRSMCAEHLSKIGTACYECMAKSTLSSEEDQAHPYKLRHKMMSKNVNSIYFGVSLNEFYDMYDTSSFDIKLAAVENMADSPDELFFDS